MPYNVNDTIVDGTARYAIREYANTDAVTTNIDNIKAQIGLLDEYTVSTAYEVGDIIHHNDLLNNWYLKCVTAGTTGSTAITISIPIEGATINDGTVVWEVCKASDSTESVTVGKGERKNNTTYAVDDIAYFNDLPTGWYLECTTAGTTGSSLVISSPVIGGTVSDGTVTWTIRKVGNTSSVNIPTSAGQGNIWIS